MKKSTSIIIIIIILIAAVAGFYYYGGSAPADTGLLQGQSVSDDQLIGSQVLALLNQIQSLKIDTSFFRDPAYRTLRDYSVTIPPQNVGRQNPFAPLPGVSNGTGATATH